MHDASRAGMQHAVCGALALRIRWSYEHASVMYGYLPGLFRPEVVDCKSFYFKVLLLMNRVEDDQQLAKLLRLLPWPILIAF